ncbi:MAG: type II toxin-antitoxin system VapC family toxin [Proteobacteria bacterium]|nr:type II toxin-antitoxin system VapC family toxin [Pseudomonadota bacterium]
MNYLLDTNIISELSRKKPNQDVVNWVFAPKQRDNLYLSCLTIGEIKLGIIKLRKKNPSAARVLETWIENLLTEYKDKIITINLEVANEWAYLMSIDGTNAIDSLLAAQAKSMKFTLVTRNIKHFSMFDIKILNPFEE